MNAKLIATAAALKCLGHPMRLHILSILDKTGKKGLSVKELQKKLQISQPETSKHLIMMRTLEILKMERRNGFTFYMQSRHNPYLHALTRFINSSK
jgi:DNA-binding transcriptional ArsR family regulator